MSHITKRFNSVKSYSKKKKPSILWVIFQKIQFFDSCLKKFDSWTHTNKILWVIFWEKNHFLESYLKKGPILCVILKKKGSILCVIFKTKRVHFCESYSKKNHTHTHTHIYLYLCACACIKVYVSAHMYMFMTFHNCFMFFFATSFKMFVHTHPCHLESSRTPKHS